MQKTLNATRFCATLYSVSRWQRVSLGNRSFSSYSWLAFDKSNNAKPRPSGSLKPVRTRSKATVHDNPRNYTSRAENCCPRLQRQCWCFVRCTEWLRNSKCTCLGLDTAQWRNWQLTLCLATKHDAEAVQRTPELLLVWKQPEAAYMMATRLLAKLPINRVLCNCCALYDDVISTDIGWWLN